MMPTMVMVVVVTVCESLSYDHTCSHGRQTRSNSNLEETFVLSSWSSWYYLPSASLHAPRQWAAWRASPPLLHGRTRWSGCWQEGWGRRGRWVGGTAELEGAGSDLDKVAETEYRYLFWCLVSPNSYLLSPNSWLTGYLLCWVCWIPRLIVRVLCWLVWWWTAHSD